MIKNKLEEYFENTRDSEYMDQVVQMLSLTDVEIENLGEEKLNILVAKPFDNYKINLQEEEMGETSHEGTRRRNHQNPFRAGDHKGYHGGKSQKFTQYNIPEEQGVG